MQIILKEDVDKLGVRGDIVKVAAGYGRNYLLPRGLAALITTGNVKQIQHEKRGILVKAKKEKGAAEEVKVRIEALSLSFKRKVGESDTLYGSVTNGDIGEALASHGIVVDKRKIVLAEPIKELGEQKVPIKLHREVQAHIKVTVAREE